LIFRFTNIEATRVITLAFKSSMEIPLFQWGQVSKPPDLKPYIDSWFTRFEVSVCKILTIFILYCNYWFIFHKLFIYGRNLSGITQMTMLWGGCWRITQQLDNIENNTIFFLKSNLSLICIKYVHGCRLCHFWYEAQKNKKKYAKDNVLPGWNDMAV
jgi:hypothetical protein